MLMPQPLAVIQTKSLHGRHCLKTPATEIAAFLQRVLYRITINVPPEFIATLAGQLGIPVLNKFSE